MRTVFMSAALAMACACAPPKIVSSDPACIAQMMQVPAPASADAGIRDDLAPFLRRDPPPARSDRSLGKPVEITLAEQRVNAAHEAGHVMADAFCFGSDFVQSVAVMEKVTDDGYGLTEDRGVAGTRNAEQIRCNAVAYLAGRAADEILNRAPDSGSQGDIMEANDAIRHLHRGYALGSSFLIDVRCQESAEEREAIDRDTALLYGCARALVVSNRSRIDALADLVMSTKAIEGVRKVGGSRLQSFLRKHPPVPPALDAATGLDPCSFSVK